jgi:hypothetical protein
VFTGHRGFFTGEMAKLLELSARAQRVLLAEDPQAVLLTPAFVNRLPVLEQYLAAGGKHTAQGLAYHLYASGDLQLLEQIRALRSILARQGLAHWPLLDTESSFERWDDTEPLPPGVKPRDAATAAALHGRALVIKAFAGVQATFHHGWDNTKSGMVTRELQQTPTWAVNRDVRAWLLGLQPQGCKTAAPQLAQCMGQRNGQTVMIVWRTEPGPDVQVAVPEGRKLLAVERAGQGATTARAGQVSVGFAPVALWLGGP